MYSRTLLIAVLLFAALDGNTKQADSSTIPPHVQMIKVNLKEEGERQSRIQLIKAVEAELQDRAADRKASAKTTPLDAAAAAAPLGSMQYNGLQGDYLGGVFGTFIAAATLLIVIGSWWSTRKSDAKSRSYQVFAEMLRTHEEIVNSMSLGESQGREAIGLILSEFSFIYKAMQSHIPNYSHWSLAQRLDIAFTFTYYGPQLQTQRLLKQYDATELKKIGDAISAKQHQNANSVGPRNRQRLFKGHQNRLSHYFRNLFGAYKFVEESSDLTRKEKRYLGKVLRAKLSNYEQALLLLNIKSHLGKEWVDAGILERYEPIKNVPEHFFSFDENRFKLNEQFPHVKFEWGGR